MATSIQADFAWDHLPARAIRRIGETPGSIAVVPVGSMEQHGDHLPVATDTLLVDAVAGLGASRVADSLPVVVTPTLWTGYSPHHLPFGGTLTLGFETLLRVVEDIAGSVLANGFDALLLVNGHGGNAPLIAAATSTIGDRHPGTRVLSVTYFNLAEAFIDSIRDSEPGGMSHGGEFETSLMLHLHPELVDMEAAEADYLDEPYSHGIDDMMAGGPLSVYRSFDEYSDTGAIGDPALATAEKGETIYTHLGDELEQILTEISEHAVD